MERFQFYLRVAFLLNLLFVLCVIQQWNPFLQNGEVLSLLLIAGWLMPLFVNGFTMTWWVLLIRNMIGLNNGMRAVFFINLLFFLFQILYFSL